MNLSLVVCPGTELEETCLFIEGEVCDVHFARTSESGGRGPEDVSIAMNHHIRRHVTGCEIVSAASDGTQ